MFLFFTFLFFVFLAFKFRGNPYINKHKVDSKNDKQYIDYLKWCRKNGEIPMDKRIFDQKREDKKNSLEELVNGKK